MTDKSSGMDFDRQLFVQPQASVPRPAANVPGLILVVVVLAAVAFLAYKLLPQISSDSANAGNPALNDIDRRLGEIEGRLGKLESTRRPVIVSTQNAPATDQKEKSAKPNMKTTYQISPTPKLSARASAPASPAADPATAQRLASLQKGLGTLQNDQAANQEAWQATTDRLAEVAGQVGSQGTEILRNQDEINQLLVRTEMEAIPFELRRGSDPQPVGPVSLVLKSTNVKAQRYNLCVHFENACIDLKDRSLHEVVQFILVRNTTPVQVIATKITKDEVLGYLEAPRHRTGQ
jgi:hypothetical protein